MNISHTVKYVTPLEKYKILVVFEKGCSKIYDINPCFEKWPIFNELKKDRLFWKVKVADGGFGVKWNSKIDLDDEELYEFGSCIKTPFDSLLSFAEASKLWKLQESTLRKAVQYNRFKIGLDIMKFGKQWVVTLEAMKREYGQIKQ